MSDDVRRRADPVRIVAPLGPKQNLFIQAYLVEPNATKAAIAAGYSPKTAASQGARLLTNAKVRKAIAEAQQRRSERVEVKQDDVLRVLIRHLSQDIGEAYDEHGALLAVHKMPPDVRKTIQSLEVEELEVDGKRVGQVRKVKFWSKDKALELCLRHLGLLKDKVDLNVKMTWEQLVLQSMNKPEE